MARVTRTVPAVAKRNGGHVRRQVGVVERACKERAARFTLMRREVYTVMAERGTPLTAYDLMDILQQRLDRKLAPPTVYRALEFLLDQGFIHRIESTNAYLPCTQPGEEHESIYFMCKTCGATRELSDTRVGELLFEDAREMGFFPLRHIIEVEGYCANCGERVK
jgi:Fur family transcriptional regulator, zinc uptake regulator